jgi:hypothetical protein
MAAIQNQYEISQKRTLADEDESNMRESQCKTLFLIARDLFASHFLFIKIYVNINLQQLFFNGDLMLLKRVYMI